MRGRRSRVARPRLRHHALPHPIRPALLAPRSAPEASTILRQDGHAPHACRLYLRHAYALQSGSGHGYSNTLAMLQRCARKTYHPAESLHIAALAMHPSLIYQCRLARLPNGSLEPPPKSNGAGSLSLGPLCPVLPLGVGWRNAAVYQLLVCAQGSKLRGSELLLAILLRVHKHSSHSQFNG